MAIRIDMKFGNGVRLFLYTIMLMFLLIGCKSTRMIVDTKIKADSTINKNISSKTEATNTMVGQVSTLDKSTLTENETEVTNEKRWSKPDSTGKQFLISDKTITRTRNTKVNKNIDSKQASQAKAHVTLNLDDKSKIKSDYKSEEKINETKKISTPGIVTWGVLILIAALIVIIVLILKRFKLL